MLEKMRKYTEREKVMEFHPDDRFAVQFLNIVNWQPIESTFLFRYVISVISDDVCAVKYSNFINQINKYL